jgi:hypothetical protein
MVATSLVGHGSTPCRLSRGGNVHCRHCVKEDRNTPFATFDIETYGIQMWMQAHEPRELKVPNLLALHICQ